MGRNKPGSKWWGTPRELRVRKPLTVTITDEAREKLERLSGEGGSKSAVVERLIIEAPEK